ncbi:MAG: hemerythrin domain-containing protein [Flavobacteriales bacterium]|jgi:hypothetical protein|nr:hemerythrin domain-containing protein [Flavobacteriales bacterium]
MDGPLYHFFTTDHRRLDGLLDAATADPAHIRTDLYQAFRVGLLTHIKMEEKILFPAAQEANGGVPLPVQSRLRLDHGALTALMVLPPAPAMLEVLRRLLEDHDHLEERPDGMYAACAALTADRTEELLAQLRATTPVPVHPPNPAPKAVDAARRALERAGRAELAAML